MESGRQQAWVERAWAHHRRRLPGWSMAGAIPGWARRAPVPRTATARTMDLRTPALTHAAAAPPPPPCRAPWTIPVDGPAAAELAIGGAAPRRPERAARGPPAPRPSGPALRLSTVACHSLVNTTACASTAESRLWLDRAARYSKVVTMQMPPT